MLKIDKHALDYELERNAQIGEEIGRALALANSALQRSKRDLELAEARGIANLRSDNPKESIAGAEKEVKRTPLYQNAWEVFQDARQAHEEWDAVYKSWIGRGYDLKALGQLFSDQYFAVNSVTGNLQQSYQQEVARAMMRQRSGDHSRPATKETSDARPRRRPLVDS